MVARRPEGLSPVRVVDNQIGVGTRQERALLRVEAEESRRGRRGELHPALLGDPPSRDALEDEVHPMLDAREAVRDLGEVPPAELLLVLEAEGAVVGRDDREIVGAETSPQRLVVLCGADGWGADVL